ncbi:ABC-type glutathione transport system ATPase component [Bradyrhizobium japonicum]
MSESNTSVEMLEPVEDRGGVAQPLLQVNGLTKHFPVRGGLFAAKRTVRAVDNVSFAVAKGETVGIVGESGCGKSTTARLLMHLMPRDTGDIIYDGMTVGQSLSLRELRRGMQMVFQDSYASLNPRLTIEESIAFGPKVHGMGDGAARALARELLGKVGLRPENFANRYPHEISGGQRQRVNIARALALSPRLVILDEAVSALDKSVEAQVLKPARRSQARVRADLSLHQPRPQRRPLHFGPRAGDVSRRGRRARPGRPGLGQPCASLHARTPGGDAVVGPRQAHRATANHR